MAVPIGLAAAIYLSEYASDRVKRIIKPILEVLAGIPTIVYGFFALTFVTPVLQKLITPDLEIFNALSPGLVMGIMITPTIASLSEDAMSAVPDKIRHGSLGLGATKFETAMKVVLPAAFIWDHRIYCLRDFPGNRGNNDRFHCRWVNTELKLQLSPVQSKR